MLPENPRSPLHIVGHPLHAMLVPFPVACCVGTLITDDVGNTVWRVTPATAPEGAGRSYHSGRRPAQAAAERR
nr:hypothetical protein [uncultured Gellertiella sp.]